MRNLYEYWKSLSEDERHIFCSRAGVSYGYMESHLIHGRKKPRMETIQAIVDASNNKLSHKKLFDFFLKKAPDAA
ncbi:MULTISPECIES: XRE family transcriptional regulator [Acinetobacter]|uniref:XRE family transcriptional regulator n=1 Tax=Acinetobacter variabilis TaxID=70346 RepID=A0A7T7WKK6_9GAMM|nr:MULTISPECIES: XRE family transcriptional regulator [Acinetobacter]QQN89406.1 XRE family transcriptional regulator [Acinetobacter variabilis]